MEADLNRRRVKTRCTYPERCTHQNRPFSVQFVHPNCTTSTYYPEFLAVSTLPDFTTPGQQFIAEITQPEPGFKYPPGNYRKRPNVQAIAIHSRKRFGLVVCPKSLAVARGCRFFHIGRRRRFSVVLFSRKSLFS